METVPCREKLRPQADPKTIVLKKDNSSSGRTRQNKHLTAADFWHLVEEAFI